ncbi:MAG: hypothetical protein GF383_07360 [Candidatus Lokiarchaeota archaeon]|nr:hypothetical protein [Candidatus Lokiarchaeota archaeon]MBD3339998.1 hypothetical protein [Candidatus Lokiarchaeota archaeon]
MARKKRKKRGFLIALMVGFDEKSIHLWKVYGYTVKRYKQIKLGKKWKYADSKQKYHYFEQLVDAIRPFRKKGLKSILLVCPPKLELTDLFLKHVNKHHRWLVSSRGNNQITFGGIDGYARDLEEAKYLVSKEEVSEKIFEITSEEANLIIKQLEKSMNIDKKDAIVIYGLKEIEDLIYEGGKKDDSVADKIDYLIMSKNFVNNHSNKSRVYRLKQIAENKGIMTRIISGETSAGSRINQFGGIICFKKSY